MSHAATDQRQAHWLSRCQISSASNTPVPSAEIYRLGLQTLCVVGVAGNRGIKELDGFFFPLCNQLNIKISPIIKLLCCFTVNVAICTRHTCTKITNKSAY